MSIAQEFSRVDEDSDIDERPKAQITKTSKIRINQTTENSITRANEMHSKIFECNGSSYAVSPSGVFNITTHTIKPTYNNKSLIKSSDNTPF